MIVRFVPYGTYSFLCSFKDIPNFLLYFLIQSFVFYTAGKDYQVSKEKHGLVVFLRK